MCQLNNASKNYQEIIKSFHKKLIFSSTYRLYIRLSKDKIDIKLIKTDTIFFYRFIAYIKIKANYMNV